MSISPFEVMGVNPGCSHDELKAMYKDLVLKTHPDKHNGNADMFNLVVESYNIIVKYHLPCSIDHELNEIDPNEEREALRDQIDYSESAKIFMDEKGQFNSNKFNETFDRIYQREEGYSNETFEEIDTTPSTLIIHETPDGIGSIGSFQNYEQGDDYSSSIGSNMDFTDYKKAYTDNTHQTKQLEDFMINKLTASTVNELEQIRNKSMEPTSEELERNIRNRRDLQDIENRRIQRVMEEDRLARRQYNTLTAMIKE